MSEHTHTHKVEEKPVVKITRNDVEKVLTESEFGKKSNHAGTKFWFPKTSEETFQADTKWYGMDWLVAMVNKASRSIFAGITTDILEEEGGLWERESKFDMEKFLKDGADFTAGVAKLADLNEEIDEIQGVMGNLVDKMASVENLTEDSPEYKATTAQLLELTNKITPLRLQRDKIKERYQAAADKRAKKEAEAKAKTSGAATSAPAFVPAH